MATWTADGLRARGRPAEVVTSEELCTARRWLHRVNSREAEVELELEDGRVFSTESVGGVLNRLIGVPASVLAGVDPDDRVYAEQEWRALVCSAMYALTARGIPVIDPPTPFGLGGRWRSQGEWAMLAARAGLAVESWRWSGTVPDAPPGAARDGLHVIVIGDEALSTSGRAPDDIGRACVDLARLAGTLLLSVWLGRSESQEAGRLTFAGASTQPDLRLAGEQALDRLGLLLSPRRLVAQP